MPGEFMNGHWNENAIDQRALSSIRGNMHVLN